MGRDPGQVKFLLNVLDYLQQDLKKQEAEFPEKMKMFSEENIFGIFDYCQETDMNILNNLKEIDGQKQNLKRLRIGIFARQLSATVKYIIHAINAFDLVCARYMAMNYEEVVLVNLTQIAQISNKSRISNQALRSLMINDVFTQILISIMASKTPEEVSEKNGEIAVAADIIYQVFRHDTGQLSLIWGDALNKTVPAISKILKDERNAGLFKEETELKDAIGLLENYMEPIFTYSIISDKDDGIMLLLIEFNKKCRYQGPPKLGKGFFGVYCLNISLGIQQKNASSHKYDPSGLSSIEDEANFLRDDIKYFGSGSYVNSPIIYMESALNILNIMASYYNNILIHYLEKDIFSGISMITNSLCLIIDRFLTNVSMES